MQWSVGRPSGRFYAEGDSAKLDRAFGDVVDKLLQILRNLIEEFMQTDEVWPLYIPVRLFRLEAEVQSIAQLLIQQINHRPARFRIQVVAGVN